MRHDTTINLVVTPSQAQLLRDALTNLEERNFPHRSAMIEPLRDYLGAKLQIVRERIEFEEFKATLAPQPKEPQNEAGTTATPMNFSPKKDKRRKGSY